MKTQLPAHKLKRQYLHKTLGDRTYLRLILGQGQFKKKKKGGGLLDLILLSDDILDCHRTSFCQIMDCYFTKFSADPYFSQGVRVQV
jgi:hypothetical protein